MYARRLADSLSIRCFGVDQNGADRQFGGVREQKVLRPIRLTIHDVRHPDGLISKLARPRVPVQSREREINGGKIGGFMDRSGFRPATVHNHENNVCFSPHPAKQISIKGKDYVKDPGNKLTVIVLTAVLRNRHHVRMTSIPPGLREHARLPSRPNCKSYGWA
jgi:hypothetical protein